MTIRAGQLAEEAVTQGAEMGHSYLDGIKGRGTLQVVRGRNLEVMEITGTWRPLDEDTDVSSLIQAAQEGAPLLYRGMIDDPDAPERDEVSTEVKISSHNSYRFGASLPNDKQGPLLHVFNFKPATPTKVVADAA